MHTNHLHRFAATVVTPLTAAALWMSTGCGENHPPGSATTRVDINAGPTHVRWSSFAGMAVPVADQGPTTVNDPVATGYSRTPAGAALAAIQTTVRLSLADDTHYPQVGRMLAAGPGRDAWAIARARISITAPVPVGAAPRLLGYRIARWSPDRTVLTIYTRQTDSSRSANTATVVWNAGDWKLSLPTPPGPNLVAAVTATPPDMTPLQP